ncbi:MAG: RluA family pseudouridine synthase [Marinicaulis sp.]|nr:RluA family pseudouridine synthase [Marinicaulis sp.]
MNAGDESLNPDALEPTLSPDGEEVYAFCAGSHNAGARLDKWLSEAIDSLTRTRLKALIEGGAIARNGEIFTDPSWRLREGEDYRLTVPPAASPTPGGEDIPLEIAFEDDDLIVVNKPAGMVVHPASGNWTGTLVNALIHHCGNSLSGIGGVARPGIVHRIDKDTSGLLVVAKNDRAHQGLGALFAAHDIDRVYEAIAVGAPRPGVGTIDAALARAPGDRKKMAVVRDPYQDNARHAISHYKILEAFGRSRAKLKGDALASLIECKLETGRTHQIRVHLSHIGHPLIGDQVYGRGPGLSGLKPDDDAGEKAIKVLKKFRRQALHARTLGFAHPVSGEALSFDCPPPADFEALREALKEL